MRTCLLSGYPGQFAHGGPIDSVRLGNLTVAMDDVVRNAGCDIELGSHMHYEQGGSTVPWLRGRVLDDWYSATSVPELSRYGEEGHGQDVEHFHGPNLHFAEEEGVRSFLDNWADGAPQGIHLIMYGLHQRSIGTRRTTCLNDLMDIKLQAAETWIDILQQGTLAVIHLVRPQEHIASQEIHFVVEFLSPGVEIIHGEVPILRRTVWHGVWEAAEPIADYLTNGVSVSRTLVGCGLREWCGDDLRTTCNLHIEKRIALPLSRVHLLPSSLVEIFVHFEEPEHEGVSLIQTNTCRKRQITHVIDRCCGSVDSCISGHNETSHDTPSSPVLILRPNPQLQQRFDDIIEVSRNTPEGRVIQQRIQPPPRWDNSPWYHSAAAAGACHRRSDGQLIVNIRSWLVRHQGAREPYARDFSMRPQLLVRLPIAIRRVWHDRFFGRETITIRVVRPSPLADPDGSRRFHIIAELNRPVVTDLQPMLVALRQISSTGVGPPFWCASLFPSQFTAEDIRNECAPQCERHHLLIPMGGALRRWMSPYNTRQSTPGLFLPGWYDFRLQPFVPAYEVDEEATNLMQRSATRSPRRPQAVTPSSTDSGATTVLAHVFHMSAEHRLMVLDRATADTYAQQIQNSWRWPQHVHFIDLHAVQCPPQDLEVTSHLTFIVELSVDRNRWAVDTDKLVLLDVRLLDRGLADTQHHLRRVLWMRRQMSRIAVLHLASASSMCEEPEVNCELKINNALWHKDDLAQRQVHHGDYISLVVSSSETATNLQIALCEQESADRQRYIYQPSPPGSSTSSPRSHDGPQGDESAAESRTSAEDDSTHRTSLNRAPPYTVLQHHTVHHRWLPHVLDLWCGDSVSCARGAAFLSVANVIRYLHFVRVGLPVSNSVSLLQRQSFYTLERLPPPGNGTIVDLRRNLDTLDDVLYFPWGCCYLDFQPGHLRRSIRQVEMTLPDIEGLASLLCLARLPDFPHDFIYNHIDELPVACWDWVECISPSPPDNFVVRQIYTDGSFDGYAEGTPTVGWGFVSFLCGENCIHVEHLGCGFLEDDLSPMLHGLPVAMSARTGEIEALIQAHLWLIAAGSSVPVELYFDAITVGFSGTGAWNFNRTDKHIRILRCLSQFLDTLPNPPTGKHVKAHTNVFGNEIANLLAQQARLQLLQFGLIDVNLSRYTVGDRMPLESLWLLGAIDGPEETRWPTREGNHVTYEQTSTLPTYELSLPSTIWEDEQWQQKLRSCELGFASYNVGTLADKSSKHERLSSQEYLREQCIAHGINVLFLQETRARSSNVVESATHTRYISCGQNGNGGTEIWIAKKNAQGRGTGATSRDVLILHAEPELLIARWKTSQGSYLLASAHAPHTGRSHADVTNWWTSFAGLLQQYYLQGQEDIIIGIDANAHFSEDVEPWIGGHGLEPAANLAASLLLDLLRQFDLFLPSTYAQLHDGTTATWRVGRAGTKAKESRCDYICLALAWKNLQLTSLALPNLDAGMSSVDHMAVGLWCKFMTSTSHRLRPRIDVDKIPTALGSHSQTLYEGLMDIGWSVDAHTHANQLSAHISEWLKAHCSSSASRPRASYITDASWSTRRVRLQLQRMMRHLCQSMTDHQCRMAFRAWRYAQPLHLVRDDLLHITYMYMRSHRILLATLRRSRSVLRQSLRRDRAQYLEQLGQDVMGSDPRYTYRILRQAGVRGKAKRRSIQPLPYLKNSEGEVVATFGEWSEVWRQQFEQQEGGCLCTGDELLHGCLDQQLWLPYDDAPPDWTQIPTLTELEGVLRSTATGKSYFEDAVPGDLLHYGASLLAKALYPLLLKQLVLKQEPILFKGGCWVRPLNEATPRWQWTIARYSSLLRLERHFTAYWERTWCSTSSTTSAAGRQTRNLCHSGGPRLTSILEFSERRRHVGCCHFPRHQECVLSTIQGAASTGHRLAPDTPDPFWNAPAPRGCFWWILGAHEGGFGHGQFASTTLPSYTSPGVAQHYLVHCTRLHKAHQSPKRVPAWGLSSGPTFLSSVPPSFGKGSEQGWWTWYHYFSAVVRCCGAIPRWFVADFYIIFAWPRSSCVDAAWASQPIDGQPQTGGCPFVWRLDGGRDDAQLGQVQNWGLCWFAGSW